jgi:hypothetical protein
VCDRRAAFGDPEPAVTTVSTHLRALLAKKLICAVDARAVGARRERMRGMLTPAQRSPHTAYVAARTPEEVLKGTLRGIVSAVPCEDRFRVILLIAEVTGAPRSVIAEIRATLLRCGLIDSQQRGEEQVQVTMEARGGPETELEGTGNEIA